MIPWCAHSRSLPPITTTRRFSSVYRSSGPFVSLRDLVLSRRPSTATSLQRRRRRLAGNAPACRSITSRCRVAAPCCDRRSLLAAEASTSGSEAPVRGGRRHDVGSDMSSPSGRVTTTDIAQSRSQLTGRRSFRRSPHIAACRSHCAWNECRDMRRSACWIRFGPRVLPST